MTGSRDRNPYAPPTSAVADVATSGQLLRPAMVGWAVRLLSIALALSIPGFLVELRSDEIDAESTREFYLLMGGAGLLFFSLLGLVIRCIARGHRWARVLYTAMIAVGYLGAATYFREAFERGTVFGVMMILQTLCDLTAVVLLFLPASNAWFKVARARPAP